MNHRSIWGLALFAFLTAGYAGCGGSSNAKFVPNPQAAREALQTALDSWKSGAGNNPIETPKVVVNVFDARWRERKRLQSFEILEEVKDSERPQFKVRMQIKDEPEQTTTYYVIGNDPLHVYWETDYKQAQTW